MLESPTVSIRGTLCKGKQVLDHSQDESGPVEPTRPNMRPPILPVQDRYYGRPLDTGQFKMNVDAAWTIDSA